MAAYGAAVSLKNTITLILRSPRVVPTNPIIDHLADLYYAVFDDSYFKVTTAAYAASTVSAFHKSFINWVMVAAYVAVICLNYKMWPTLLRALFVKFLVLVKAYFAMSSLQKVLLKLDDISCSKVRTKVNDLDERIKEAVWEFEDLLESHYTNQILPQLESETIHLSFSVDLWSLKQSIDCFVERMAVMEAEYEFELLNMPEEEGEPISSRIDFRGINSNMVGSSDLFEQVRDCLIEHEAIRLLVTGMAGVGKTATAMKIFEDPLIKRHFELRVWVKVGRVCQSTELLQCILAQEDPNTYKQMLTQGDVDDEKLVGHLKERLMYKKCLIVLDDVWEWDTHLMDKLEEVNVRILVTSRLAIKECVYQAKVCLLSEDESSKLLGYKVFGEEGFPPHLEKLGEKIAKKCEGLPLMLVTVAELLCKEDKTAEFWTEVAQKQHNSVFMDSYNQISEVLFPSYDYLPQYLKMFFLYMGAYPPYSNIDKENFAYLSNAEGFLEPLEEEAFYEFLIQCSTKLGSQYNLILLDAEPYGSWFSMKDFRVHSCWQHVCKKEASKIKFLHVLQSCDDVIKDQRRLCIHCNTLFAFKQVYDSIKSDCTSNVRSLLCLGPYHQYPVPIHDMDLKLLRVLDAVKVRFYHIPLEIMKLVCLRYLALTCNLEIPGSISNLLHLQSLIIKPHMNIRKCGVVSHMPAEIWDMQDLVYIEVTGRDLPTPNSDATLKNLYSISGVSAKSCTGEILKKFPDLYQLKIVMELKPYDDDDVSNQPNVLSNISEQLQNLKELKYNVRSPDMNYQYMFPLSMFPSALAVLHLSGSGCPWKHMNDVGSRLPNLSNLKLKHYAFRGSEWNIEPMCFLKLETLVIEDTDLVRWRAQHGSLPMLELLSIRHCYKLRQLDWVRDTSTVQTAVELVECNPLAVTSANQLGPESLYRVRCHSTF